MTTTMRLARHFLYFLLISLYFVRLPADVLNTVVGFTLDNPSGSGCSGLCISSLPQYIIQDKDLNYYYYDTVSAPVIRKIRNDSSHASVVVGGGDLDSDNVPATSARISGQVSSLAIDNEGNLYYSESTGQRIRKVANLTQVVTTLLGTLSQSGLSFDGSIVPLSNSFFRITSPRGLLYHSGLNALFFIERSQIRSINFDSNPLFLKTRAGAATSGYLDNISPMLAKFNQPRNLALDTQGNMYVADYGNCVIRKITARWDMVTTIAGNLNCVPNLFNKTSPPSNLPDTTTSISFPSSIAVDNMGNVFFTTYAYGVLVRTVDGMLHHVAGNRTSKNVRFTPDTPPKSLRIAASVDGLLVNDEGDVVLSDLGMVWKIENPVSVGYNYTFYTNNSIVINVTIPIITMHESSLQPIAGFNYDISCPSNCPVIPFIASMWLDASGTIFITDRIRNNVYTVVNGNVSLYAGTGLTIPPALQDDSILHSRKETSLDAPVSIAGRRNDNGPVLFVAENTAGRIRMITRGGSLSLTSSGESACAPNNYNGSARSVRFCGIDHLAYYDNLLAFTDNQYVIRILELASGKVFTVVGSGDFEPYYPGYSGLEATIGPVLALSYTNGILYYYSTAALSILANDGYVYIGNMISNLAVVGSDRTLTSISVTNAMCMDTNRNLYFSQTDSTFLVVSTIDVKQSVELHLGVSGNAGLSGEYVDAHTSYIGGISGCQFDTNGYMYFIESSKRIRRVSNLTPTSLPSSQPTSRPTEPISKSTSQPTHNKLADTLNTYAGATIDNPLGDGCSSLCLRTFPRRVTQDSQLNYYYIDNIYIRKAKKDSLETVLVVGGGKDERDISLAKETFIFNVVSLALDSEDNLFYMENFNCRLRKLANNSQIVTTVVGVYRQCASAPDGPISPFTTMIGSRGLQYRADFHALFFVERLSARVRLFNLSSNTIMTVAGAREVGFVDNVHPLNASFPGLFDLFVANNKAIYITDTARCSVMRINENWTLVTTIAGRGCNSSFQIGSLPPDNVIATSVFIGLPFGISVDDNGNVFFSTLSMGIFAITTDGILHHIAGNANSLLVGPSASPKLLRLATVISIFMSAVDNALVVVDSTGGMIWKMSNPIVYNETMSSLSIFEPKLELIAGFNYNCTCPSNCPVFSSISSIYMDSTNTMFVADSVTNLIYRITEQDVSLYAGTGISSESIGNIPDWETNPLANLDQISLGAPAAIGGSLGEDHFFVAESYTGRIRVVHPYGSRSLSSTEPNRETFCAVPEYVGSIFDAYFCGVDKLAVFGSYLYFTDNSFSLRRYNMDIDEVVPLITYSSDRILSLKMLSHTVFYYRNSSKRIVVHQDGDLVGNGFYGKALSGARVQQSPITAVFALCVDNFGNYYFSQEDFRVMMVQRDQYPQRVSTYIGMSDKGNRSGEYVNAYSSPIGSVNDCLFDTKNHFYFVESRIRVRRVSDLTPSSIPTGQPSSKPSYQPSGQPTSAPSSQPTIAPTLEPTRSPTSQPTSQPSIIPSSQPTCNPTVWPTPHPTTFQPTTTRPTLRPSIKPSRIPTSLPTCPSSQPTSKPSNQPSCQPSANPSQPTSQPNSQPSGQPSTQPSRKPSRQPSSQPSFQPSAQPVSQPTDAPSNQPTRQPSPQPSSQPSRQPTPQPNSQPTRQPTAQPSRKPSAQPSTEPSAQPSTQPSSQPLTSPTSHPSQNPTSLPSRQPSSCPSSQPSPMPSSQPDSWPSACPTTAPSVVPTCVPTAIPSCYPTAKPSVMPSSSPSQVPTGFPTTLPSSVPSVHPSSNPTSLPSPDPSSSPSSWPTATPSSWPTTRPSSSPFVAPSSVPTISPTSIPSSRPTAIPSNIPSSQPSAVPSAAPSSQPSGTPSNYPSSCPSSKPSVHPSSQSTAQPTRKPSSHPSSQPTNKPTSQPSSQPSIQPSSRPTNQPSRQPVARPSSQPSRQPVACPTGQPSTIFARINMPTRQPTCLPTRAPTLSVMDQWKNALQDDLIWISMNDTTNQIASRKSYYSLQLSGQNVFGGGCTGWSGWLSTDLVTSVRSYAVASFDLYVRQSLTAIRSYQSYATCNEKAAVLDILAALTSQGGTTKSLFSVACQGRTWNVQRNCSSISALSAAAVCVDCANPCTDNYSLSISHCSRSYQQQDPLLSFFSVTLQELDRPPVVQTILSTATAGILQARVVLDNFGMVYCGVFRSVVPQSLDEIALQNMGALSVYDITNQANSSSITVAGLTPMTTYGLYCFAISLTSGSRSSLAAVLQSGQNVTTSCCRKLYVRQASLNIAEGTDQPNFLTVEVEGGRPRAAALRIGIILQRVSSVSTVVPNSFVPSNFILLPDHIVTSSSSVLLKSSLSKLSAGVYRVILNVTGSTDYDVVYSSISGDQSTSYSNLTVSSSNVPLAAPLLVSAFFAVDGSFLQIAFSADTNRAGMPVRFSCALVFRFACAQSSSCVWRDSATVLAYVDTSAACAIPGQNVSLAVSAAVKARCLTTCSSTVQLSWPNSSVSTSVLITAPVVRVNPTVVLSMPTSIGSCSSLLIDATASKGDGGQMWASSKVEVSSVDLLTGNAGDVSSLQIFLQSVSYSLFPQPSVIPAFLLPEGYLYVFQVTLCNFLEACSSATRRLTVLSTIVPSLAISGSSLRSVKRNTALSVTALGSIPACGGNSTGGKSTSGLYSLVYSWTISRDSVPEFGLISSSKDPSRFVLGPYALSVNTLYTIDVTATIVSTANSWASNSAAAAAIQVWIVSGDLVAVIEGGTTRSLRVGQLMWLDASRSYDEDVLPSLASTSSFQYTWTCLQVAPSLSNDCKDIFNASMYSSSANLATLQLRALQTAPAEGQWTVVVTEGIASDRNGQRSAHATVVVTILPALAPIIQLSTSVSESTPSNSRSSMYKINALQPLQLVGTVEVPAQLTASVSWAIDPSSSGVESLASVVLVDDSSISNISLPASLTTRMYSFYLPLHTALLPSGFNLHFSLSCSLQPPGVPSSASISVFVNSPPRPGIFLVSPEEEVELTYLFSFSCARWLDEDLPLTYQFGFVTPGASGSEVVLRSKLLSSFANLALSAGLASQNYTVICFAQVFDSFQSNATSFATVRVLESPAMSSEELQDFVLSGIQQGNATSNVDALKQASSMSSFILNRVNCTLAPTDCSSRLNRLSCYRTPHTCGPCLDGYVGDDGDSNELCVDGSHSTRVMTASMYLKSIKQMKPCPANCSGHGQCHYKSLLTQDALSECVAGDLSCVPNCQCEENYLGSFSCSLTEQQMEKKQELRELVISGLTRIVELEDVDAQGLQALTSSLALVSQNTDEISEAASSNLLELASYVVDNAQIAGLTNQGASDVLVVIQLLMSAAEQRNAVLQEHNRRKRRRLEMSQNSLSNFTLQRSQDILNSFATMAAVNLAPGQNPLQFAQSSFRMHVGKYNIDSVSEQAHSGHYECKMNASVSLPSRQVEQSLGLQPTVAVLPLCSNTSSGALSVSLISIAGSSYGNEVDGKALQGDPLSISLSAFPCSDDPASCFVNFVINRESYSNTSQTRIIGREDVMPEAVSEVHNITCQRDDYSHHDFVCASTGLSYNITCQGQAETRQGLCPYLQHEVHCASLMGNFDVDYGCRVLQVTDKNITCSCPLVNIVQAQQGERRLQESSVGNFTVPSGSVSVSYVSLLRAVTSSFTITVLSADDLSAGSVTKGYRVLITLGTFIVAVVAALIYSSNADQKANKVNPGKIAMDKKQKRMDLMAGANAQGGASNAATEGGVAVERNSLLLHSKLLFSSSKRNNKTPSVAGVRQSASTAQNLLDMAEEALPNVLRARSFPFLVKQELKRHHRWFGVIYHYSDQFPRVLRVVSLATNIVIMLFVQSITYNLSKGDDGTCGRIHNEMDCVKTPSPYATGESKCYWVADISSAVAADGECKFVHPNQSIMVVLFVAVFSALVSIPISFMVDLLVNRILAAPLSSSYWCTSTSSNVEGTRKNSAHSFYAVLPVTGTPSMDSIRIRRSGSAQSLAIIDDTNATALQLFHELQTKLRTYYLQIAQDVDKIEFRAIWGLDSDGSLAVTRGTRSVIEYLLGLKKGAQSDISSVVFRDVLDVQKTYNREVALFQDKEFHMAAREKSRRLLYLFQKDLMPGICGQILESKDMRDNVKVKSVPGLAKTLAWTFLLVMNAVMLFYIYLFAVSQDEYRQTAWAQSFALWLVAEIFLISTCMVLVMNVAIPSVIMKDVQAIKTKLVGSLVEYHRQLQNDHQQDQKVDKMSKQSAQQFESNESSSKFNAAEYLFVSYRLAQTFMQLKTAKVIAHYQTVWPRQSYQHVADVSRSYNRSFTAFTRSASIIILFFVSNLLTVPITLQDMVVHAVTTAAAGYACLLHLQLYTIYPVLVVAPTLCILMVIHFFLQSHKTQQEGLHTLLQKAAESSRQQDKTKTKSNDLVDEDAQEGNNPEQQQVESALKYIYYGKKLRAFQQRKHEQAAKDIVNAGSRSNAGAGNKGSGLDDDDLLHFPRRAHDDIEEKSDDDSCSYSSDCRSSSGGSRNSSDSYRSADEKESDDDEYYDEVSYSIVPQPRYQANQHVGRRQSVQHGIEIMAAAQRHVYKSSSSNSGSSSASSSSEDGKKQSDSESSHSSQDSYDSEDIHSDDHDTEADEGKHVSSGGVNSIHNKDKSEYFDDDSEENADKMYSIENDGTIVYYDVHGVEQYRERANALDENTQSSSNQLDNGGYSYVCGSRDSYSYSDSESRSESDDDSDTP